MEILTMIRLNIRLDLDSLAIMDLFDRLTSRLELE